MIKPKRLRTGDTVALVATGSPFERKDFDAGVKIVASLGFKVKHHPLLFERSGYLAGSDEHRARLLTHALTDDEVRAVFCVRGGYGTLRMLKYLDVSVFRSHPKIVLGYSDVTSLLNLACAEGNLITFHGPMLVDLEKLPSRSFSHLSDLLTQQRPFTLAPPRREIIQKGRVQGRLMGGNLTTLAHLIGTPYEPSWEGRILFVEDCGEKPYRIDRLFTQLKCARRLDRLAGLVLGQFTDGVDEEQVWEIAYRDLRELDIPIVGGFPLGHGKENMAVPIGGLFRLDGGEGTLELIEPCTAD